MTPILDGIRVLDLSQYLAGPHATLLLSGMGAEVIRVDNPKTGDSLSKAPVFYGKGGPTIQKRDESDLGVTFLKRLRGKKSITLDLKAPEGASVRASADGLVALVGEHYFAGKSVYLDHGTYMVSMYFHLSEVHVREGEPVRRGQVIGKVGKTGRATGPHLHWGVRVGTSRVDPFSVVRLFEEAGSR